MRNFQFSIESLEGKKPLEISTTRLFEMMIVHGCRGLMTRLIVVVSGFRGDAPLLLPQHRD